MEDLKNIVAKNLSELRRARGMTQLELAEELNYSDKAISKWERGESLPDIAVLKYTADFFNVSVDYLIEEDHTKSEEKPSAKTKLSRRNCAIITSLAVMTVWLIATAVFSFLLKVAPHVTNGWTAFIYAVPCSAVVLLIFNSIWGENKKLNYLYVSLIVWTVLASVYMTCLLFFDFNFWTLFLIGVPAQIIILLWSGLRFNKVRR